MDPLFPADSVAELAAISDANLPHTAVIETMGIITLPGGVKREQWTVAATVPCRLMPVGAPIEQLQAGQLQGRTGWMLTLSRTVRVTGQQRATVTGETDGVPWTQHVEVIGPIGPHSYQAMTQLLCASRAAPAGA